MEQQPRGLAEVIIIAAVAKNGVIGRNGQLPWQHLPGDLPRFQATTVGAGNNALVYGRKTSISMRNRALPNRLNLVLSRKNEYLPPEGVGKFSNLKEAIDSINHTVEQIFVIGGHEVFREALKCADRMILTEVFDEYEGDVKFPWFDRVLWKEVNRSSFPDCGYAVVTYKRIIQIN